MSEISDAIDLSGVPEDQFAPELELRVAVVREDKVLGSTVVKAASAREKPPFSVRFDAPVLPGGRLPCPVRLIVGPNVNHLELISLETLSMEVELALKDD